MAVHAGNVHDDGSGLDCRFGCGRAVGEAIGTAWAGGQAVSMTSASVWNVIWYGLGACLVLGIVAFARVACFNLNQLFEERSEVKA